jgi:hypothetical protein
MKKVSLEELSLGILDNRSSSGLSYILTLWPE